jgi:hypothetical protein
VADKWFDEEEIQAGPRAGKPVPAGAARSGAKGRGVNGRGAGGKGRKAGWLGSAPSNGTILGARVTLFTGLWIILTFVVDAKAGEKAAEKVSAAQSDLRTSMDAMRVGLEGKLEGVGNSIGGVRAELVNVGKKMEALPDLIAGLVECNGKCAAMHSAIDLARDIDGRRIVMYPASSAFTIVTFDVRESPASSPQVTVSAQQSNASADVAAAHRSLSVVADAYAEARRRASLAREYVETALRSSPNGAHYRSMLEGVRAQADDILKNAEDGTRRVENLRRSVR